MDCNGWCQKSMAMSTFPRIAPNCCELKLLCQIWTYLASGYHNRFCHSGLVRRLCSPLFPQGKHVFFRGLYLDIGHSSHLVTVSLVDHHGFLNSLIIPSWEKRCKTTAGLRHQQLGASLSVLGQSDLEGDIFCLHRIVWRYGSVSNPCTPGEHQNSW